MPSPTTISTILKPEEYEIRNLECKNFNRDFFMLFNFRQSCTINHDRRDTGRISEEKKCRSAVGADTPCLPREHTVITPSGKRGGTDPHTRGQGEGNVGGTSGR